MTDDAAVVIFGGNCYVRDARGLMKFYYQPSYTVNNGLEKLEEGDKRAVY